MTPEDTLEQSNPETTSAEPPTTETTLEMISGDKDPVETLSESVIDSDVEPYEDVNDDDVDDEDIASAKQAWSEDDSRLLELAEPFVGQWNQLISTTNWEKGEIIHQWRLTLMESGAPSTEYSDDAWARRVGGVTAPHVGRLRRVYERFGSTFATYEGLYWSHFLAALDWEDAPLWLEGAVQESWSISAMREKRWQATGAVESQRPTSSQIIDVELDEDVVLPAQGGGKTKEYDDDPSGIASGPRYDEPDFGEEEEFNSLDSEKPKSQSETSQDDTKVPSISQPFAGLPDLPDDLADAIESLKLAILRHKSSKWEQIDAESIERYLFAMGVLLKS